jgi:hypothetical protein
VVTELSTFRPDEIDLFRDLVDYYERRALVGRPDDEFLVAFIDNDGDLTHPGLAGSRAVSMRTLRRFAKAWLIEIFSETDAAMTFGLADDFRERWASLSTPARQVPTVFISVSESHKVDLARPFRDLLGASGIQGIIVSDEPQPSGTFGPEAKVDAYLDRSDAVVVFATADIKGSDGTYPRLNIADEIARARKMTPLRDRICVLREHGAKLPSNVNPAYDRLDPAHPDEAFRRALRQLAEWGQPVSVPPATAARSDAAVPEDPVGLPSNVDGDHETTALLERADELISNLPRSAAEPSLVVILAGGPRRTLLRPAQLEDPALARDLTKELLFGDDPVFDSSAGTDSIIVGDSLVIRQGGSSMTLDPEGGIVLTRPIWRRRAELGGLRAVIDEDVRDDLAEVMRLGSRVLERVDGNGSIRTVVPVVVLAGATSGSWRTRAEHLANPNSMTMNITLGRTAGDRAIARLRPPGLARGTLVEESGAIAADLTILLRRESTRSS